MASIVALGAVTVGINLTVSNTELCNLGLTPGSYTTLSGEQMKEVHQALENYHAPLPYPRSGGSIGNTATLLARAELSCGMMGVGGDDSFGRAFISDCKKSSVVFLSKLEDGAVTGYDFYLFNDDGVRTILWTSGANSQLSPAYVDIEAIQDSDLLLLDGSALSFGPESEAAMLHGAHAALQADIPFVLTLSSIRIVKGYRDFFSTFAPKAQMVAGNLEQAAVLVGLEPDASLNEVRIELAKTSIDAVITLDEDGAFARFSHEEFLVSTKTIKLIDSTGAGDAFLAAFLIARRKGLSVSQALTIGNIISAEVIQYEGARLPTSVDVPKLIKEAITTCQTKMAEL